MAETFAKSETVRIEAFSDGVFAIAITLLILAVEVPKASELGEGGRRCLAGAVAPIPRFRNELCHYPGHVDKSPPDFHLYPEK